MQSLMFKTGVSVMYNTHAHTTVRFYYRYSCCVYAAEISSRFHSRATRYRAYRQINDVRACVQAATCEGFNGSLDVASARVASADFTLKTCCVNARAPRTLILVTVVFRQCVAPSHKNTNNVFARWPAKVANALTTELRA